MAETETCPKIVSSAGGSKKCCPHCPAAISRSEVNQARIEARAFGEADE